MAVKKITKNKVIPKLITTAILVDYTDLNYGAYFLMGGSLWIKEAIDDDNQGASSIITGGYKCDLCGTMVIPINVEIHWNKK